MNELSRGRLTRNRPPDGRRSVIAVFAAATPLLVLLCWHLDREAETTFVQFAIRSAKFSDRATQPSTTFEDFVEETNKCRGVSKTLHFSPQEFETVIVPLSAVADDRANERVFEAAKQMYDNLPSLAKANRWIGLEGSAKFERRDVETLQRAYLSDPDIRLIKCWTRRMLLGVQK